MQAACHAPGRVARLLAAPPFAGVTEQPKLSKKAGLGRHFPERGKQGGFSRSPQGRDACVARVAMDGHPGLARSRDCAAQWVYGGPENACPIPPSCTRTPAAAYGKILPHGPRLRARVPTGNSR
jgi:hypothetical protein